MLGKRAKTQKPILSMNIPNDWVIFKSSRSIHKKEIPYEFLSNEYPSKITLGSNEFLSAEQAFHFMRAVDYAAIQKMVLDAKTPAMARKCGSISSIRKIYGKRCEFKLDIYQQIAIMKFILFHKFVQNPPLLRRLLDTGNMVLCENTPRTLNRNIWCYFCKVDGNRRMITHPGIKGFLLVELRDDFKLVKDQNYTFSGVSEFTLSRIPTPPNLTIRIENESLPATATDCGDNPDTEDDEHADADDDGWEEPELLSMRSFGSSDSGCSFADEDVRFIRTPELFNVNSYQTPDFLYRNCDSTEIPFTTSNVNDSDEEDYFKL